MISIALDLMSRYDSLGFIRAGNVIKLKPFYLESIDTWHKSWDWVFAIILASVVAYVVLDSVGKGKRILFWRRLYYTHNDVFSIAYALGSVLVSYHCDRSGNLRLGLRLRLHHSAYHAL